jgi:hypothetical protein
MVKKQIHEKRPAPDMGQGYSKNSFPELSDPFGKASGRNPLTLEQFRVFA